MTYKIDKNVPLTNPSNLGKWTLLAKQINVGDSVLLEGNTNAMSLRNAILRTHKDSKVVTRREGEAPQIRLWRTK
jgi:hypothetical protein